MTQLDIFSVPVQHPAEARRLSGQCAAILARLHQGPATNRELAGLSLKYTSRLSEVKAAGWDIRVVERDYETGRVVYQLFGRKP
jgi:hypothetical protein